MIKNLTNNNNKIISTFFRERNASYEFKKERRFIFLSFFIFFMIKKNKKTSIKRLFSQFLLIYDELNQNDKSLEITFEIYYNKYIFWPAFRWFSFCLTAIISITVVCLIAGLILSQPISNS